MYIKKYVILISIGWLGYACRPQAPTNLFPVPDWGMECWEEVPENPMIGADFIQPNLAIGDPQILTPDDFDGRWHMFYHGFHFNEGATTFFHQMSEDGVHWTEVSRQDGEVGIQYLFCDGDRWIQYYTCTTNKTGDTELARKYQNIIRARTTTDFIHWSEPVNIITPETPMERDGYNVEARNPCVILLPDGRYRMYYSAGTVFLRDAGYEEPKYIFCAEANHPLGPFIKKEEPVLAPDVNLPFRNYGCGGFKAFGYKDGYIAFYNPIYIDENNKSRSEIRMLVSSDGLDWKEADCNPIVKPEPSIPWRSAIVYQLDVIAWNDALWMYFNAREGWRGGIERIGCVRLPLHGKEPLAKLKKSYKQHIE
jgi:hypothetical protein